MHMRNWLVTAIALLAFQSTAWAALALSVQSTRADDVRALDGEWIYVEDRTEGRPIEKHQPSMSSRVRLRVEEDAVVLIRSDGEIRMALDGTPIDVPRETWVSRYRGQWKDGTFTYESETVLESGGTRPGSLIRWELRVTEEGLLARASVDPPDGFTSLALYRHAEDIALPEPAEAAIDDLTWIAGAWVGTRGTNRTTSIEERWSPPLGGAMLGVSRTVSRERMRAFEYLRIVERDGGLVYIAQPNGSAPTEFVLTEVSSNRAVFENPRHNSPQRIVYEIEPDGGLVASIGYAKGGKPQRFEFAREED